MRRALCPHMRRPFSSTLVPALWLLTMAACKTDEPKVLSPPEGVTVGGNVVNTTEDALNINEQDHMNACDAGIRTVSSGYSFDETVRRLEAALAESKYENVTRINHESQTPAEAVANLLPGATAPTSRRRTVILSFDRPELTRQLIAMAPSTALDLPARFIVWEDAAEGVSVTWSSPRHLATRHDLQLPEKTLTEARTTLEKLTRTITTTQTPPDASQ